MYGIKDTDECRRLLFVPHGGTDLQPGPLEQGSSE